MRTVAMFLLAWLVLAVVVAFCVFTAPKLVQQQRQARARREWDRAVMNALWEPYTVTAEGVTGVGLVRVARTEDQFETVVVEKPFVEFPVNDPDWGEQHDAAMFEARRRCIALNEPIEKRTGQQR